MAKRTVKKPVDMVANVVRAAVADAPASASAARKGDAAAAAVRADPIIINQMNAEPFYQSRVGIGSIFALFAQVIPLIVPFFGWDGEATTEVVSQVGTVAGILYALYGRFASGLKPLGSGSVPSDAL